MVTLDLDRQALDRTAGPAVTLEIAREDGQIALEAPDHGHRLASAAALLAKHAHDTVVRKRRPFLRGRPPVGALAATVTAVARVDEPVVRHAVDGSHAERLSSVSEARPNEGHRAIAELERQGFVHRVLTQNVDGLHRAAGSREPLELHGTLSEVECPTCGFRGPKQIAEAQLEAGATVPLCPACGANLKTAVVLFGELLPPALGAAHAELSRCDLLICCGSSLQVYPVAAFPERVHGNGGEIAVVNLGPTGADQVARVQLDMSTGEALPSLVRLLGA